MSREEVWIITTLWLICCFVRWIDMGYEAKNSTGSIASHDLRQLQDTLANDLSSIANWLKTNHLQMNVTKTKLLLLARRSRV